MNTASSFSGASPSRSRRRVRALLAGLATYGLAALAWASFGTPLPRLVYNPTDSVAAGWYRIKPVSPPPESLPVGSIVLTRLPADAATLAAQRGYLPLRVPLLKRVGAVAPQHVCIVSDELRIDGVLVASVLRADRLGRLLPAWPGCRRLKPGELFLLSTTNPASFDSRYFGPILVSAVLGIAQPIQQIGGGNG